jgi:hypothetical protein
MYKTKYLAEIDKIEGRILVIVRSLDSDVTLTRAFHNICDAEHWLLRLSRKGLRMQDCSHLLEQPIPSFELPPVGPVRILDKRVGKRTTLSEIVS